VAALALADPSISGSTAAAQVRQWSVVSGGRFGQLPYARKEADFLVRRLGRQPAARRRRGDGGQFRHVDPTRSASCTPRRTPTTRHPDWSACPRADRIKRTACCKCAIVAPICARGCSLGVRERVGRGMAGEGDGLRGRSSAAPRRSWRACGRSEMPRPPPVCGFYRADGERAQGRAAAAQHARIRAGAPAAAWAGVLVLGDNQPLPKTVPESPPASSPDSR
jgi:hypothetical protein